MADRRKMLLIGGAALLTIGAVGAWKYSSTAGLESTQGAIGKREVYRDNATKPADVAVTPGAAPVADQANAAAMKAKALDSNATSEMKAKAFDSNATSEMKAKAFDSNATSEMKAKVVAFNSEMKAKAFDANFNLEMKAK